MALVRPSTRSPRSSSASRNKGSALPKDLLTVADIPRKKISDLIKLAKQLKAAHGKGRPTSPSKGKRSDSFLKNPRLAPESPLKQV